MSFKTSEQPLNSCYPEQRDALRQLSNAAPSPLILPGLYGELSQKKLFDGGHGRACARPMDSITGLQGRGEFDAARSSIDENSGAGVEETGMTVERLPSVAELRIHPVKGLRAACIQWPTSHPGAWRETDSGWWLMPPSVSCPNANSATWH